MSSGMPAVKADIERLIADIERFQEQTARYLARQREQREQREQKKQRERDEETLAVIRVAEEQHREFVLWKWRRLAWRLLDRWREQREREQEQERLRQEQQHDKGRDRDRDSRPDGREGGAGSRQQEREPKRQRQSGYQWVGDGDPSVTATAGPDTTVGPVQRECAPAGAPSIDGCCLADAGAAVGGPCGLRGIHADDGPRGAGGDSRPYAATSRGAR